MMKPSAAQILVGIILLIVAALLVAEMMNAWNAQPCPNGDNCYPWGAEGPAAGTWVYASKTNYLLGVGIQLTLALGVGVALIKRAGSDQPLSSKAQMFLALAVIAAAVPFFI